MSPPPNDLEAALVPIIARILDADRGPPGLTAWVFGRTGGRPPRPRGPGAADRGLARRLAREAARAIGRAGLDPVWETHRPEEPRA